MSKMHVTFMKREVHNPLARFVIILFLICVVLPFLLLMLPILLVLHPFFRLFGLVGTVRQEKYGQISLKLDRDSFRRAR